MNHLEIQSNGEIIASENGVILEDAKWNLDYDGKKLELETIVNDDYTYAKLNNKELVKLFNNLNNNPTSLQQRLNNDFPVKKSNKKTIKKVRFAPSPVSKKNKISVLKDSNKQVKKSKKKSKRPKSKRKIVIHNE
jgi:hypothetical protein